ncbi:MAG: DSBA oxidoreductase [Candidatus Magasanikbacteria bacterium GW2011_GWC2_40_17]|uniref:DSBA oxidoreductase n=1 Tax=Candidatus Magasanikbacteria bacterium GW2011_GWA2_42_32 TaxID=1619039 RepID=A0A0G1A6T7_9BACT|nr:MAG: DSBA oxidoreductase [Candidatus Magasanikbacteria bacterium GW2011_GWC2_40_17]KKS56752.1 MAG: DSBA oxidoreductase [Candidatus Magasanikbacteria bacterium GW2011_GWA2_42_32]OGH86059.1 MAG: hypothetical protein A2294_02240 [Candidatus Magasanikbacteria bacterium RIFOXYB2_FULL_38_10]
MQKNTKIGWTLIILIVATASLFYLSVRLNTPPPLEEILTRNQKNTNDATPAALSPSVTIADPQLGPSNAKITIVEFADFNCSHCVAVNDQIKAIAQKFPQDVKIVWKDFPFLPPLDITWQAHMASRCAGKQNKFWEYHDLIFANQNNLNAAQFISFAQKLNLDITSFETCLSNEETRPLVQKAYDEGKALGIEGTPFFYVNGKVFSGELNVAAIQELL